MGPQDLEWLAGVGLALIGNIFINLGLNVMKLRHNQIASRPSSGSTWAAYKHWTWQIGFALYVLGGLASFFSFGYAAQTIVAAIGCIQFVSNVAFATLVLHERATYHVVLATVLIVGGCVLLVLFGNHNSSQVYTVSQLMTLYSNPAFIIYLTVGAAAAAITYAGFWMCQKHLNSKGPHKARLLNAMQPVLYSIFSALICTQAVLYNKMLGVLFRSTLAGDNQFNKWFTWLAAMLYLFLTGLWALQLDKGLKMFPALIIIPSMQLCFTLFSIICGMLFFEEYTDMPTVSMAMVVLGVMALCLGACLLIRAPHSHADAGGSHAPEPDEQCLQQQKLDVVVCDNATEHNHEDNSWSLKAVLPGPCHEAAGDEPSHGPAFEGQHTNLAHDNSIGPFALAQQEKKWRASEPSGIGVHRRLAPSANMEANESPAVHRAVVSAGGGIQHRPGTHSRLSLPSGKAQSHQPEHYDDSGKHDGRN